MKFLHLGVCFTLCMCLEAKEVRQISRLIPLEDWIDFKNRTRDVKPLDKLIGKLRATYDFVFHKPDNVTNVGKILDQTSANTTENVTKIISNVSFIERRKATGVDAARETPGQKEHEGKATAGKVEESTKKNIADDWLAEGFGEHQDKYEGLENFDDTLILERLEILDDDDDDEDDDFFGETDDSEKKNLSPHSRFALPYAIAQALLRWIISLYLSTSNHFANVDSGTRESA